MSDSLGKRSGPHGTLSQKGHFQQSRSIKIQHFPLRPPPWMGVGRGGGGGIMMQYVKFSGLSGLQKQILRPQILFRLPTEKEVETLYSCRFKDLFSYFIYSNPLPTFTEKTVGITKLDLKMQEIRKAGLENLVSQATTYRENATDIHDALSIMKGYLRRLKTLCVEVCIIYYAMYTLRVYVLLYSYIHRHTHEHAHTRTRTHRMFHILQVREIGLGDENSLSFDKRFRYSWFLCYLFSLSC